MAYSGNEVLKDMCPVFGLPGVLSIVVNNSAAETNIPVSVPWKNCRLAHAETVVTTAIDGDGAMEIDLELNAAGGTEMMSITVAASSAVGDVDYASVSNAAACNKLDRDNTSRDVINIEVDGSATGTGQVMLFLYFEPANLD